MLEDSKDPYTIESWYDFLKYNGGYDYSKKGYLTNHAEQKKLKVNKNG